jgi:hypothetical protein
LGVGGGGVAGRAVGGGGEGRRSATALAVAETVGATVGAADATGLAGADEAGALADGSGEGVRDGVGSTRGDALARGVGVGAGASVGGGLGGSDWSGDSVATGASVTRASGWEPAPPDETPLASRRERSENAPPIANPTTTTAIRIGTNGNERAGCGGLRRRRGGSAMRQAFRRFPGAASREEARRPAAKATRVIRIPVPIDVGTIAATACGAFALATPLRVDRLLELAVREALGTRAPEDKRERSVRSTLAAFRAGKFVVDIDGRTYERPDAVVVVCGFASLRFFSTETRWRRVRRT